MGQASSEPTRPPHRLFHAFVVGNNAYSSAPLTKCENDADDMSSLLAEKGFNVTKLKNASLSKFTRGFDTFLASLVDESKVFIHFSGHGIERGAENYLLPTDAEVTTDSPDAGQPTCSGSGHVLYACDLEFDPFSFCA